MSQENVEIIRAMMEPFDGVDVTEFDWGAEPIREMLGRACSPEVELRWSATGPDAAVYRGIDGVIQGFRGWVEPFSEYRFEPLDFIEAGDHVVVPNRQWGIGRTSQVPVEIEVTYVYVFRDGQIVRLDEYDTLNEALEAAGLSE